MNDWFDWNNTRCTTYGIHVVEQPLITIPPERVTYTNVPGHAGSLTRLEADYVYDDMILAADCVIADPAQIPTIAGWLRGSGKVTFGSRQGGYYNARVVNQIAFDRILRGHPHRSFTVNFRCKPFFYLTPGSDIVLTQSSQTVTNPGSVPSEPRITIAGSGDITLMVGQQIIELSSVSGNITLDSELQEAYYGTTAMNDLMEGYFPMLNPGSNTISWDGSVTSVTIKPRWRTL